MPDSVKAFAIDPGLDSPSSLPPLPRPLLQQILVQQLGISGDSVGWPRLPFNYHHSKYSFISTTLSPLPSEKESGGADCLFYLTSATSADRSLPPSSPRVPPGPPGLSNWLWGWLARERCECKCLCKGSGRGRPCPRDEGPPAAKFTNNGL